MQKTAKKFFIVLMMFGMAFSNAPFLLLTGLIDSFARNQNIVDTAWRVSQNDNVVDKFTTYRHLAEKVRVYQAYAATLQYVGGAEASGNSAAFNVPLTSLTGGTGGAVTSGDLVIVATGFVQTSNLNPGVSTAGYTEVADLYQNDSRDANFSVNWKVMGGTPDTAVNCLGSGSATNGTVCIAHVWRNADPTTPIDVTRTTAQSNNSAIPNSPAITPVTAGAVVLSLGLGTGAAADNAVAAPSGYGNQMDMSVDPGNAVTVGIASKAWSGSGLEDPAAWTNWTTSTADSWAAVTLAIRPAPPPVTTLSDFASLEPSNATIAPGASALLDAFGLQTSAGVDTVTGAVVTLAAGTGAGVATVAITNDGDTVTYCSAAPSGDVATLAGCSIPVTTTDTQFKVKITALSHAAMPPPPGGSYAVTGLVTSFTSTNVQSFIDDMVSATITIDNTSPSGATSVSGLAGDTKNTLNWTTSSSADFNTSSGSVILRWVGASAGAEVPVEGSTYTAGNTITTATVACVISSAASAAQSKVDGTGGSAGCTTTSLVNGQSYTYKVFQKDTNGNYDVGVTMGTFTPSVGISITSYTNSTETALNYAAACTGCGARIGGGAGFRQSITITGIGFGADPGALNRSSATNNIKVGTQQIASSNVTAWTPTAITFLTDSAVAGDTDADWGTTFGGASALTVTASGATSGGVNFYVFPQITSITQPAGFAADTAREYDAGDTDGVITLNGTRFGSSQGSGSVTVVGQSGTIGSWTNTAIQIQVPTTIVDTVNTGSIAMTQGTDANGKTHTYANTLRVIPRILSNTADTDVSGNRVKILGNHFCQGASCPISPNRSTVSDNVKFGTTQALDTDFINSGGVPCSGNAQAWTASEICVQVPAGIAVGSQPTKVTSNTSYVSNTKAFTVPSTTPNDPNITAPRQYKSNGTTVIAHMGSTNESTVILKADISAALAVNMALQVEVDATGAGFDGVGIVQGTVGGGGACTSCTSLANAQVTITGLVDGDKQWRARVINTTTLEVSGWVYYVNPSTAEIDFTVDTLGPTITFPAGDTCTGAMSQLGTNSVQINWSVNELATGQVEYSTDANLAGSTLYPATPAPANLSHQVTLLNLDSGTTYYFKVKAQDGGGNLSSRPTSNPYCSLTTGSNLSPSKTTKFHIIGSEGAVTSASPLSQNFTVVIPEDATTTKSIFVEIRGIYTSGASSKDIVVQVNSETAKTYVVPPSSTSYFKITYPMSTITNDPGVNTLTVTPQANTSINITSANVVVQYTYTP